MFKGRIHYLRTFSLDMWKPQLWLWSWPGGLDLKPRGQLRPCIWLSAMLNITLLTLTITLILQWPIATVAADYIASSLQKPLAVVGHHPCYDACWMVPISWIHSSTDWCAFCDCMVADWEGRHLPSWLLFLGAELAVSLWLSYLTVTPGKAVCQLAHTMNVSPLRPGSLLVLTVDDCWNLPINNFQIADLQTSNLLQIGWCTCWRWADGYKYFHVFHRYAFSALTFLVYWLGVRKSIWPVKIESWGAGVVVCLQQGANDLHMIQLMSLPPHHLLLHQYPEWFNLFGAILPTSSWKGAIKQMSQIWEC